MAFRNISVHGTHSEYDKIKFTGRNTQKNIIWKCSGDTYKEIYDWLLSHAVIGGFDYDPVDDYLLEKLNKTYDDYTTNEEIDFDKLYKDGAKYLTDEAYYEIISNDTGNAYYQEWEY